MVLVVKRISSNNTLRVPIKMGKQRTKRKDYYNLFGFSFNLITQRQRWRAPAGLTFEQLKLHYTIFPVVGWMYAISCMDVPGWEVLTFSCYIPALLPQHSQPSYGTFLPCQSIWGNINLTVWNLRHTNLPTVRNLRHRRKKSELEILLWCSSTVGNTISEFLTRHHLINTTALSSLSAHLP